MSEDGGKRWLRCGCFGCLALVVLVVVVAIAVLGVARMGVSSEAVTERELAPTIPAPQTTAPEAETAPEPGKVVAHLTAGEFVIKPARPGESLHVEARYDEKSYELRERFEPGDGSWTYEVDFRRTGSMVMSFLRQMLGGTGARVEIYLPVDVPLDLELEVQQGGGRIDLGGLWLRTADIEFGQGGFALEVGEPLREPMERLTIHGAMGGFKASKLGHASPRVLDVECKMGGMDLDLSGDWVADADITIRSSQGGGQVRLPHDVEIVGIETTRRERPTGGEEIKRPTLTFTVSSSRGELEIVE